MAMSDYRSQERRRLAAQCVALAQQSADPTDRAFLLEMAQSWFRLAELNWQTDQWRALQAEIGQALRAEFELPSDPGEHLLGLLTRLDERRAK
jgi:hypothetical protein